MAAATLPFGYASIGRSRYEARKRNSSVMRCVDAKKEKNAVDFDK
jgi:hypothetical protein